MRSPVRSSRRRLAALAVSTTRLSIRVPGGSITAAIDVVAAAWRRSGRGSRRASYAVVGVLPCHVRGPGRRRRRCPRDARPCRVFVGIHCAERRAGGILVSPSPAPQRPVEGNGRRSPAGGGPEGARRHGGAALLGPLVGRRSSLVRAPLLHRAEASRGRPSSGAGR